MSIAVLPGHGKFVLSPFNRARSAGPARFFVDHGQSGRARWAVFIRGDRGWGTENNMQRAEQEGLPYLFKLRITAGVKITIPTG